MIKISSYIQYWDVNNLYGWAMLQKLLVNNLKWIEDTFQFNEDFIKNYNEKRDERFFLEVDVQYLEKLNELHNDLPFLLERMKVEKVEKLEANLHDKTEHVIHISNLNKLMNNAVFGKTMENVRKYRDIKLVTTERRRNYLASEPNYHARKFFAENLLPTEMKKPEMLLNTCLFRTFNTRIK